MLLHSTADLDKAEMADLLETFNKLTGKSVKKFENRAAAIRRTREAMSDRMDKAIDTIYAVAGVSKPVKKTTKAGRATIQTDRAVERRATNPYAPGTTAAALWDRVNAAKNEPARVMQKSGRKHSPHFTHVRPTEGGTSRLQANSKRNEVYQFIVDRSKRTKTGAVERAKIEEHFQHNCIGYLQKLFETRHIETVVVE